MVVSVPGAGVHYPRSLGELQSWFAADADCLDYLTWLRWPDGFVCPACGGRSGWQVADGRFKCAGCGKRTSVTAGTAFDRRRTPLTVWFTACWLFASQKDGISAQSLQRKLEIGSYQTAWAMLHRLRRVLVRPGRERLTGAVEVDETYIVGLEPGLAGGRAKGKKVLVGIAVEILQPRGYGRCRMTILPDGSAAPAGAVRTLAPLLPGVHRVASLAKRWLLGTHQGSVTPAHLGEYLAEFVFRFNRRSSRSRGMLFYRVLELGVAHAPVRYRDIVVDAEPKQIRPTPPGTRGHPPSLDRPRADHPWRSPLNTVRSDG